MTVAGTSWRLAGSNRRVEATRMEALALYSEAPRSRYDAFDDLFRTRDEGPMREGETASLGLRV
jgi:hypothetical protein